MDSCARGAFLSGGGFLLSLNWLQAARVSNNVVAMESIRVDRRGAFSKRAEHSSCSELITAFVSVGVHYAYPQPLKIARGCLVKGESCDEFPAPSNQRITRCSSLLSISSAFSANEFCDIPASCALRFKAALRWEIMLRYDGFESRLVTNRIKLPVHL